jgi:hypothetical protein
MKRSYLFIGAVAFMIGLGSCAKLIQAVYPGQDITLESVSLSIPPIPIADSAFELPLGSFTTYVNTDSTVRANTNGAFGINSVASVKVKEVALQVSNSDALNNLSAFKSLRVLIASDVKTDPSIILDMDIPASATSSFTEDPSNSPNIVDYLHGTHITYWIYGSFRHTTNKTLDLSASIILRAD